VSLQRQFDRVLVFLVLGLEKDTVMCYKSLCQNCILLNTGCSFATLWQGDIPYIKRERKHGSRIGVPKIPMQLKFYCMTDFESDVQ